MILFSAKAQGDVPEIIQPVTDTRKESKLNSEIKTKTKEDMKKKKKSKSNKLPSPKTKIKLYDSTVIY